MVSPSPTPTCCDPHDLFLFYTVELKTAIVKHTEAMGNDENVFSSNAANFNATIDIGESSITE